MELRALSVSGAQAGSTVDLSVVAGDRLEEVDRLLFSHPGLTAELQTLDPLPFQNDRRPHYGNFKVQVAEDVPTGRYEVRAVGRHGLSNPRAFLVSGLPHLAEPTVSHELDSPTPLPRDTWLQTNATGAAIDFYTMHLDEGQSVRFEKFAQRLDSRMIGVLELFDATGRLVAMTRGADAVDPVLGVTAPVAGEYVLAVRDILYRGGNEFSYQVVWQQAETATDFTASAAAATGALPSIWMPESASLPDPLALATEPQPVARGEAIQWPHDQFYWFAPGREANLFEWNAKEGDALSVEVISQRLGEPTDARLTVQRIEPQAEGEPKVHDLQTADDSAEFGDAALRLQSRDPAVQFKAPMTAAYRLQIHDLDVGESVQDRQKYRLRIDAPKPDFVLVAYHDYPHRDLKQTRPVGSKLFRGGAETIRVFAIRRDGWTGAIEVVAENLPEGVTCEAVVIAENQKQVELVLAAKEDAVHAVETVRIIGSSLDQKLRQAAVPATIQRAPGAGRDFIQSRLTTGLQVAVSEQDVSPLTVRLGDGDVPQVKQGETLTLPVRMTRREGGNVVCVLRPRDLPANVTAGEIKVEAEQVESKVELKVAPNVAVGRYSIWLQGETKVKVRKNPQLLERAEAYRVQLQAIHDDPAQAANLEAIKAAIAEADKAVEAAKGSAKPQDITIFVPTNVVTFQVLEP